MLFANTTRLFHNTLKNKRNKNGEHDGMRWWCCFRRAAHTTDAVRSRAVLQVSWPLGVVFFAVRAIVQALRLAVNIKTGI